MCLVFQYHFQNVMLNVKFTQYILNKVHVGTSIIDTPSNSLMDSIANQKVKTTKGEGVGARSLTHNISRVKGHNGASRWDQEDLQAIQLLTRAYTNRTTSWLMHNWNTLVHGRTTSKHGLTRLTTTQTWGKPPPSPLSIFCAWPRNQHPNVILSWDSQMGILKFPKLGLMIPATPVTSGAHNFVCKPPIEMRSQSKLQPSLKTFQQCVRHHLYIRKLGRFLIFIGRKSNCQFYSRPFFWP